MSDAEAVPFRRTSVGERDRAARYAVLASQRGRILEGAAEAAAEKGYAATTLADIVARARVSRTTFYGHFANKEECFLAAIALAADVLRAQVAAVVAATEGQEPADVLRAMVGTFCDVLAAEPEFARTYLVEALAAGERARAARDAGLDVFVEQFRQVHQRLREADPAIPAVSDTRILLGVLGIADHIRRLITQGEGSRLQDYLPEYAAYACRQLGVPES